MYLSAYVSSYIATAVFCGILVSVIGFRMYRDVGSQSQVQIFTMLCVTEQVAVVMQALWVYSFLDRDSFPRVLNWIVNAGDLVTAALYVYLLYLFIATKLELLVGKTRGPVRRIVATLPIAILITLIVSSPRTHAIFYISDGNAYVRGSLYFLQVTFCYTYYFITLGIIARYWHRYERIRGEVRQMAIFSAIPFAGGLLQVVWGTAPFTVLAVTGAMVYYYTSTQAGYINLDSLTGINNRKHGEELLRHQLARAADRPIWLFMCDIDYFKSINDTWGHLTGDLVLREIGTLFHDIQDEFTTFTACRYGGDEFLCFVSAAECPDPEAISRRLEEKLVSSPAIAQTEAQVSLTFGYTRCDDPATPLNEYLARADSMLYDKKRSRTQM